MSAPFEELDRRPTAMGEISLRRRLEPSLLVDVYEVKLDDEFLMSSLFTVAEVELARLSLSRVEGSDLDVVVAGLGLGYTARAVLEDRRVRSLDVIEALGEVIEWHRRGLVPLGTELIVDRRCQLVNRDFFAMVRQADGFGPARANRYDAILVDIDHTPRHLLHPSHAPFYTTNGLRRLAVHLHPGGVFALWSDDPTDGEFIGVLDEVFASSEAHAVTFANPHTGATAASTVCVAVLGES